MKEKEAAHTHGPLHPAEMPGSDPWLSSGLVVTQAEAGGPKQVTYATSASASVAFTTPAFTTTTDELADELEMAAPPPAQAPLKPEHAVFKAIQEEKAKHMQELTKWHESPEGEGVALPATHNLSKNAVDQFEAAVAIRQELRHVQAQLREDLYVLDAWADQMAHQVRSVKKTNANKAAIEMTLGRLDHMHTRLQQMLDSRLDAMQKLRMLAQRLPTVNKLPNGKAENVVRAVRAILDTNGYTTEK